MLSNMRDRNQKSNTPLSKWIKSNNYRVIVNSSITKRNRQDRQELIVVYENSS